MKTIEQLAREAGIVIPTRFSYESTLQQLQRFHALAIEQEHKRLLEGVGEPKIQHWYQPKHDAPDYVKCVGYTADQMAAAVLRERERCAKVCDEHLEFPSLTPKHCADAIRNRGTK